MSRTDKDTPWWVVAEYWKPVHRFTCVTSRYGRRDCDLPPEPLRRHRSAQPRFPKQQCHWMPEWPPDHISSYPWSVGPAPRWFRDHVWRDPERALVRDQCILARKEYNGNGEVDVIPSTEQHRHCAAWLYW